MNIKILYAGYGYIGIIGLMQLLSDSSIKLENIFILLDESENNKDSDLVCKYAREHKMNFFNDDYDSSIKDKFDICISVHWRKMITNDILSKCKHGGINLHPSLLPKYAGCSSLAWAIMHGDSKVGFTWHQMENSFDTGDIIIQEEISINNEDTSFSLWNKANLMGISKITKAIEILLDKKQKLKSQDINKRSYYPRGFPSYENAKELIPDLNEDRYKKAKYFPGKD